MAKEKLYIKTTATPVITDSEDEHVGGGWVDAYEQWGMSLEPTALSRLMAFAPSKEPVTNKNVISHGASIVQSQFYKDVRQVSLEMHISAPDRTTFLQRYKSFQSQVIDPVLIHMKHSSDPSTVYHFLYLDCPQFTQFRLKKAKFMLSLEEPHPEIRT